MKYFAVIDTNVLVSALLASLKAKDTPPVQILDYILDGIIIPVYNDEIIAEYTEVLNRAKFAFPTEAVTSLIAAILSVGIESGRTHAEGAACVDPDDTVFYEVTLSVQSSYLVTGNIKHFPANPSIVTPAQMLEIIQSEGQQET